MISRVEPRRKRESEVLPFPEPRLGGLGRREQELLEIAIMTERLAVKKKKLAHKIGECGTISVGPYYAWVRNGKLIVR